MMETALFSIGIDIGATKTIITILNSQGEPVEEKQIYSTDLFHDSNQAVEKLAVAILDLCMKVDLTTGDIRGIAVGFPGVMDSTTQVITSCPNLPELNGLALGSLLNERLNVPVYVDKDTNFLVLGESLRGHGVRISDFAGIYVGSGIGCGLILNGRLYTGADGSAGEFGHIIVEPNGKLCTCGGIGCLEMYCSGKALALLANSILEKNEDKAITWKDAEQVITAARAGHPVAKSSIETAFEYLGLGVTSLTNILNLRMILLGGGIINGWPEGISIIRKIVSERARASVRDHLIIEKTKLGNEASYIGAYAYIQNMENSKFTDKIGNHL